MGTSLSVLRKYKYISAGLYHAGANYPSSKKKLMVSYLPNKDSDKDPDKNRDISSEIKDIVDSIGQQNILILSLHLYGADITTNNMPKMTNLIQLEITYSPVYSLLFCENSPMETVHLENCPNIASIPKFGETFTILYADNTGIKNLTDYDELENIVCTDNNDLKELKNFKNLRHLLVRDCPILTSVSEAGNLERLELTRCPKLTRVLGDFKGLQTLSIEMCPKLNLLSKLNEKTKIMCIGDNCDLVKKYRPKNKKLFGKGKEKRKSRN